MRKVSLLTLASIVALSSAVSAQTAGGMGSNSGNMMRSTFNMENPLYKPTSGMFYSKTNFNYQPVKDLDASMELTEEFGYGFNDKLSMSASIGYGWMDKIANPYDKDAQLSNLALGAEYRAMQSQVWIWDIMAGVSIDTADDMVNQYSINLPINDFGKKDTAIYLATRIGFNIYDMFDMAFNVGYSFDLDDKKDYANKELGDTSYYYAGLEGQLEFNDDWSMNLGYRFQKFANNDGFDKAAQQLISLSGNWQATDMTLLSLYADYDVSGKSDRKDYLGTGIAGVDGDDNRWSMGARVGVQF